MTSPLPRLLLMGLLALASAAPGSAGEAAVTGSWTSLGPDGGAVTALASPVGSPKVIYAGVFGGVFKSVDGGVTWKSAGRGLELLPEVSSLAIDPLHPSTLYAGAITSSRSTESSKTGVYKSVDGGATWRPTGLGLDVLKIVIHPRFPQTIFATTTSGLYQSSNGGGKWRLLSRGVPPTLPFAFAVDPTSPRRMFSGFLLPSVPFQTGLFKSLDGGFSWQPVQSDLQDILTLAIDPRSPKTIYASPAAGTSFVSGLFRSTNEGRNWTQCFVSGEPIRSLVFPPTQKNLVYAAGFFPGLYRSLDGGATWSRLPFFPASVHSVLVSPTSATTLLMGADSLQYYRPQESGVYKSIDGGISWTRRDRGLTASSISSLALDTRDSDTLWTVANRRFFKSSDRGQTWSPLLPLDYNFTLLSFQQVVTSPVDPETVYVGRNDGELLRSRDGGQNWAVASGGGGAVHLKADPRDAATLWAFGNGIGKSTDGGDTWTDLPGAAANGLFFDLAFSPSSPSIVYAAGDNPHGKTLVLRSADAGVNWTVVQEGGGLPGFRVLILAVDSKQPETVYAVTDSSGDIHKTVDGGSNWSLVNDTFHDRNVQFLTAGPSGALYAAVLFDNVYESEDGGLTWAPLGDIPKPFSATSLAADPKDPCRVYAGTLDRGLLTFTKTGTAVCP